MDFLKANSLNLIFFITAASPCIISLVLHAYFKNQEPFKGRHTLEIFALIEGLQAFVVLLMTFNPLNKKRFLGTTAKNNMTWALKILLIIFQAFGSIAILTVTIYQLSTSQFGQNYNAPWLICQFPLFIANIYSFVILYSLLRHDKPQTRLEPQNDKEKDPKSNE